MQKDSLILNKIFILSDLHFGKYHNAIFWKDNMIDYLQNEFIRCAYEKGLNKETDELFILGDIFDSRESLNTMIFSCVVSLFRELVKHFKKIRIIIGNHDSYYVDNNDITTVQLLQYIIGDKIVFYDKPEQLIVNNKKIFLLPWIKDVETLNNALKEDDSDYLFCHADINGMKYANGLEIKGSMDKENFKKYKMIFSGHIHIRQERDNVLYVGTPYQLDLGDIGNTKGFYYIDCENFSHNFVENTYSPMYKKILIYDLLNYSIEEAKKAIDNCFTFVLCDTKTYTNLNLVQLSDKLTSLGIKPVSLKFEEIPDFDKTISNIEDLSKMKFDMIDASKAILKEQNKSEKEIDAIIDYLTQLHEKVKIIEQ